MNQSNLTESAEVQDKQYGSRVETLK